MNDERVVLEEEIRRALNEVARTSARVRSVESSYRAACVRRDEAMVLAKARGASQAEIARRSGLIPQRISQILASSEG